MVSFPILILCGLCFFAQGQFLGGSILLGLGIGGSYCGYKIGSKFKR